MTSKPGRRGVERVAADSNVILSAVVGKAALKVFTRTAVKVIAPSQVLDEIREYLPEMAALYELAAEAVEGQFRLLAIEEYERRQFEDALPEAERRLGRRDPEDVELLALALKLNVPIWSNDSDFRDSGVEWYTTARLLKNLGI